MSKNSKDIVFVAAQRSAIGRYKGIYKDLQAHNLGSLVIKSLIEKTKLKVDEIDEVILGQVLTGSCGQNPARQAAINSGIPKEKTAIIINQVCGSGLRSIVNGYQSLITNSANFIIAGGQESMTNSLHDQMMKDGLTDAFYNYHMGVTAENVAAKYNISRQEQDEFALQSQHKAKIAIKNKKFDNEIINNDIDEHPRTGITINDLSKLNSVFKEKGTVTPGNSSGINDGAAAVVLTTRELAEKNNLEILGKIISWATCGVDPSMMGLGPIPSSNKALEIAKWNVKDLDLIEINEAFAAQSIAVIKELKVPKEKVNVNGGAIALGHPIGASGARIIVTLLNELKKISGKKGLATLCIGGGMGISMCIEKDLSLIHI